ncbi:MAG: ABC transporter ATP-binding protein [Rhodospirillales bacterium]|nr:ABC transporter ATP-binding protein [Rhodospirillales bacterium]
MTDGLLIEGVAKGFGGSTVLADVSLAVAPGEAVALLGPSGSGKSTLLRLVAGFERTDRGRISFDGTVLDEAALFVAPERRRFGFVFQNFALWPHLDAARNVRYPLDRAGVRRAEASGRAESALRLVGLAGFGGRDVALLSGGQRQRVALARAMVAEPRLVLLDEPLANLDPHLKGTMLAEIAALRARAGAAMLYVTHDQGEAMAIAGRIAVIEGGRLRQVADPRTLYREPADAFVAGFVGRGALLPAMVVDQAHAQIGGQVLAARMAPGTPAGPARALIRPEGVRAAASGLAARVLGARYRGGGWELRLALGGGEVLMDVADGEPPDGELRVTLDAPWIIRD